MFDQQLIVAACEVRRRAYAPYSKFHVGAALLAADGSVFTGCNVENASYGLTVCAERNAVFAAVAAGQQKFAAIAIATSGGHSPCGACRQVLAEFAPALPVLLVDADLWAADNPQSVVETDLATLLPGQFRLKQ